MSENATEWFGMRVTPIQKEKIERLADREGTTLKDAVERELAEGLRPWIKLLIWSTWSRSLSWRSLKTCVARLTIPTYRPISLRTRSTWKTMATADRASLRVARDGCAGRLAARKGGKSGGKRGVVAEESA